MMCSGFESRPGRCDLCKGSVPVGEEVRIRSMRTGQRGHACRACADEKCWNVGPCCRKAWA